MSTIEVLSIEQLQDFVGQRLGPSPWVEVDQERVDTFAATTLDQQWIHVDVPRAEARGGTVAHGYLTLSFGPYLLRQILDLKGVEEGLNYGADRLRFPAPLMVGSRLRLWVTIRDVAATGNEARVKMLYEFEAEGSEKPPCVAEVLSLMRFSDPRPSSVYTNPRAGQ